MTLKRGDLALIVRNTLENACTARVIGTPVEVASVCLNDLYGFGPVWQTIRQVKCPGCGCFMGLFLEADLQRLQPPGKGDETRHESPADVIRALAPRRQVEFSR